MKQWFKQLAPRERHTLIIGAILLASILVYFLLWEPFIIARTQLVNIVAAQKVTLRWMSNAAVEVQQNLRLSHIALPKKSLLSLIDKSILRSALNKTHKRIEQKVNGEVRVNFEHVSFTELMRWLEQLYKQYQVEVTTISVERLNEPDKVKVHLILKL